MWKSKKTKLEKEFNKYYRKKERKEFFSYLIIAIALSVCVTIIFYIVNICSGLLEATIVSAFFTLIVSSVVYLYVSQKKMNFKYKQMLYSKRDFYKRFFELFDSLIMQDVNYRRSIFPSFITWLKKNLKYLFLYGSPRVTNCATRLYRLFEDCVIINKGNKSYIFDDEKDAKICNNIAELVDYMRDDICVSTMGITGMIDLIKK